MRPAFALLGLLLVSPSRAEDTKPASAAEVQCAIDAGVAWLKSKQRPDGSWGPCRKGENCYLTGPTSLAVFALSRSGVPKSDRSIRKALKWLRDFQSNRRLRSGSRTSYEYASLVLMLTELNKSKKRVKTTRNRHIRPVGSRFTGDEWRWMIELVESAGYQWRQERDVVDAMFASLAARASAREGYPVGSSRWWDTAVDLRWYQNPNGGFPFGDGLTWSTGETAAGLATLLICREQLALKKAKQPPWLDDVIKKAYAHLRKHFDPRENYSPNPPAHRYHYCYLYAAKVVGTVSRRLEIGSKDWYLNGARWLLKEQKKDGRWVDRTCIKPRDVLGTCFALLFLERPDMVLLVPTGD